MHDPMSDAVEGCFPAAMSRKPLMDRPDRRVMIASGDLRGCEPLALRIGYRQPRRTADARDLAMDTSRERPIGGGFERREFDARRTGVDDEDRFMHSQVTPNA